MAVDAITNNALISTCDKGQQPERAPELLKAMQRQGMVTDVITNNALIIACEKGRQPKHPSGSAAFAG